MTHLCYSFSSKLGGVGYHFLGVGYQAAREVCFGVMEERRPHFVGSQILLHVQDWVYSYILTSVTCHCLEGCKGVTTSVYSDCILAMTKHQVER